MPPRMAIRDGIDIPMIILCQILSFMGLLSAFPSGSRDPEMSELRVLYNMLSGLFTSAREIAIVLVSEKGSLDHGPARKHFVHFV